MKLKPFFSFYGGKHRHGGSYPRPLHGRIVEPFAGSAGYATRHHSADVTLVDSDPIIAGVWRYLIGASRAEILALPLIGPDETLDVLDGAPQEARWLVGFWLAKAETQPRRKPSPWMRSGKWPGCFWGEAVRLRIASQLEHIRHWKVVEGSYADVLPTPATWFLDPPYQHKGIYYRHSARRIDFAHLGAWARALPGQVVVCEQHGADWLPFRPLRAMKTLNRGDGTRSYSREVIWTKGCEPEIADLFQLEEVGGV